MGEESDVIRHQIEQTRESLGEKLDTLEAQVKEAVGTVTDTIETVRTTVENTVESVKSGVEGTVDSVKNSLHETVDAVKQTFDLPAQIERHPWGAVGCSLAAGVAVGYMLHSSRRGGRSASGIARMDSLIPGYRPDRPAEAPQRPFQMPPTRDGFLSKLFKAFEGEFDKVKELAIVAAIGIARDTLKEALPPSLAENVTTIMDDVTRRLGGEPIRGSVLETGEHGRAHAG